MNAEFRLRLERPRSITPEIARTTLTWGGPGSTFVTQYDAHLSQLGEVRLANVELTRIAAAVFAADRSLLRAGGGSNWNRRKFTLTIPVYAPARWQAVSADMSAMLHFLSGDDWDLRFTASPPPLRQIPLIDVEPVNRVVLLSGGADSACGAIMAAGSADYPSQSLVSIASATNMAPVQRTLRNDVERVTGGAPFDHKVVMFRRRTARLDGTRIKTEDSSRTRSLLYLAFGLAVASVSEVPLLIPENGFASLNPPLGPERRGTLSTRTTHPLYFARLRAILLKVGAHADFSNPFSDVTKGEMFTLVKGRLGATSASELLSSTHSCSTTALRSFGLSPLTQCGVCYGCIIRRASFKAADIQDKTAYASPTHSQRVAHWLNEHTTVPAMGDFVAGGISERDVAAMALPDDYVARAAYELCQRGLEEIREYLDAPTTD